MLKWKGSISEIKAKGKSISEITIKWSLAGRQFNIIAYGGILNTAKRIEDAKKKAEMIDEQQYKFFKNL